MPLYEYECEACGQRFELIRKFSDPPVEVCDLCGKGPVNRLVSSPAIQFKGSGWYITDYAQKGKGGKTEKTEGESGGKTAETKTGTGAADKTTSSGDTGKSDTPAKPSTPATPPTKT